VGYIYIRGEISAEILLRISQGFGKRSNGIAWLRAARCGGRMLSIDLSRDFAPPGVAN
jgi:hypothetical protein